MSDIQKYKDVAMFEAEPHTGWDDRRGVLPKVYLQSMTHRPLATMAAMNQMYVGNVIHDLDEVTPEMMEGALDDMSKTHLTAPMEAIRFQFLIEGVDRAFTHQMVRQRMGAYAQESLRFAVIGNLKQAVTLPPSLQGTHPSDTSTTAGKMRERWDDAVGKIQATYDYLVANGMSQEDARGLLPHAVATRIIYISDFRNMVTHAGNRLCTQAQFHWRDVFSQIVTAIGLYGEEHDPEHAWEYHAVSDSPMFRPVCWQIGKCGFKGSMDRACGIREKVDFLERNSVPTSDWDSEIPVEEWLLDPEAAVEAPHS